MEVDAVIVMFQRSEALYGLKYANYIGDGDSKIPKGTLDVKPYQNLKVSKKDCIDHVKEKNEHPVEKLEKKKTKNPRGKGRL